MKQKKLTYFLAANSCEGFYSVFDKSYLPDGEWRAFIIKGGPGTGKSSFMKRLAAYAESAGIKTVLCPCSSDPDSLDAVILPDKKRVIMDGTAPHTVDPSFPAYVKKYLISANTGMTRFFRAMKKRLYTQHFATRRFTPPPHVISKRRASLRQTITKPPLPAPIRLRPRSSPSAFAAV